MNDSLIEESLPSRAGRNSLEGTERHHQNGTRDGGDSEEEEERDPEHPTLPIASIEAVAVHFNYVGRAREQVVQNMENMVGQGLETLVGVLSAVCVISSRRAELILKKICLQGPNSFSFVTADGIQLISFTSARQ